MNDIPETTNWKLFSWRPKSFVIWHLYVPMSSTFKFVKYNPTKKFSRLTTLVIMPCVQLFLNQSSLPSGYPKLSVKHLAEKDVPCFSSIMPLSWLVVTGAGSSKSDIHLSIWNTWQRTYYISNSVTAEAFGSVNIKIHKNCYN